MLHDPAEMAPTPAEGARPATKNVLVVDDHPLMRLGLTALIASQPGLAVQAAVGARPDAFACIRDSEPDLATIDVTLGDDDGLDVIREMRGRHPKIPWLVLSHHDEEIYAERALRAGASGYVSKRAPDATVLVAIRRVLAGETYMSEALQRRFAERYVRGRALEAASPVQTLTDRELQVFRLIGLGRSTRQIAVTLARSVKTIESHIEHIKNKLGLGSAAELIRSAALWVETGRIG